jgi:AcrR family transcriptional regulator
VNRAATKGDDRRAALLEALDHHLRDAGPDASLDAINVADLSRRAGVTRSAFYFYFDNKAAAVAALMEEMYDDAWDAAELDGDDDEGMQLRVSSAIRAIFRGWSHRTYIYRAMLEARASSPAVREQWDSFQESFVVVLAAVIEGERTAGVAPAGADPTAIATALLDLNDRTLERLVHAPPGFDWDKHVEAVVHIWLSSIYGRTA